MKEMPIKCPECHADLIGDGNNKPIKVILSTKKIVWECPYCEYVWG